MRRGSRVTRTRRHYWSRRLSVVSIAVPLVLICGIVFSLYQLGLHPSAPDFGLHLFQDTSIAPPPTAAPSEVQQTPWQLNIPSIGVTASVQLVGTDSTGHMGVPSNFTDVGMYKAAAQPGQVGAVVLAGHLNAGQNKLAVFSQLNQLKPADKIELRSNDAVYTYQVVSTQNYAVDQAPLDQIFGTNLNNKKLLNLITCSGSWDKTSKQYNQRLVVYTELVE
jgi:sortase A